MELFCIHVWSAWYDGDGGTRLVAGDVVAMPPGTSILNIYVYKHYMQRFQFLDQSFFRALGAQSVRSKEVGAHKYWAERDVRKYILYDFRYVSGMSLPTYRK